MDFLNAANSFLTSISSATNDALVAVNVAMVCLSSALAVARFAIASSACTSVSESCTPAIMLLAWKPADRAVWVEIRRSWFALVKKVLNDSHVCSSTGFALHVLQSSLHTPVLNTKVYEMFTIYF